MLYPPDAGQNCHMWARQISNLRVVSAKAAVFVDLQDRRGDVLLDQVSGTPCERHAL